MRLEVLKEKHKKIFSQLKFFPDFYLAGGTALALQIGHRISVDFDFFGKKEIEKKLFNKIKKVFKGSTISTAVNNKEELTVFVDNVKLTFLHYPFPLILKRKKYKGINFLSVKEIAATKAYTIGRRGTFKDYVDLYFIIKNKCSSLEQIIKLAQKKYKEEFNARLFLEQLIYLEDIEDIEIVFLKKKIAKQAIQNFFENEIKKIKL
ncbi:nucleotidyl transferase AbiEii/AbiGii toxin family protein [Patescibacteria group bacterium]|nr:nucleotidyl transferase AbiEii/AbiGii toxin family protein [Patescibacteria group bacterium]